MCFNDTMNEVVTIIKNEIWLVPSLKTSLVQIIFIFASSITILWPEVHNLIKQCTSSAIFLFVLQIILDLIPSKQYMIDTLILHPLCSYFSPLQNEPLCKPAFQLICSQKKTTYIKYVSFLAQTTQIWEYLKYFDKMIP